MALFLKTYSVIALISLLIAGGLAVVRRYYLTRGKTVREYIHPAVFSFFTALYAFFLGFALVTLWTAYLTTEADVTREADALLTSYRLSKNLPKAEAFRTAMQDYVKSVVEEEWGQMERGGMSHGTAQRFDQVWDAFLDLKPENQGDNDIYTNLSGYLSTASQQRLSRALHVKGNLYPPVWVIIIFGFLSVCYGLYFTNLEHNLAQWLFEFMVVFLVLSCIFFIYDIDTPFSGYIIVDPLAFQDVYTRMLSQP